MVKDSRFVSAVSFAAELHAQQVRKGTEIPYLAHLLAVTAVVLEHGGSEDQAIAALLHDAVEDQGPHYPGGSGSLKAEIERRFGANVRAIVEACTDAEVLPKPPWRARKEAYVAHIRTAGANAVLVSAADKLHNARAILRDLRQHGAALWSRFSGGRDGTLWYYRALVTAFRANPAAPVALVDELDRIVTEIEALAGED